MLSADKLLAYINGLRAEKGDNWGADVISINFEKGMTKSNSDKAIFYDVTIINPETKTATPITFLHKFKITSNILPFSSVAPTAKSNGKFQRFETRNKAAQLTLYKYSNMPRVDPETNEFNPPIGNDEPISPAFMIISYVADYVNKQLRTMLKLGSDLQDYFEENPYKGSSKDTQSKFAHYKRLLDAKNINLTKNYTIMGDSSLCELINEIMFLNPTTKDRVGKIAVLTKSKTFAQAVKLKTKSLIELPNPMIFMKMELRNDKDTHKTKAEIAASDNFKDAFIASKKMRIIDRSGAKNLAEANAIEDGYTPTDAEIGDYIKRGQTVVATINMSGLNTSNLGISLKPKIEGNFIIQKQPSADSIAQDNLSDMLALVAEMDGEEFEDAGKQFASFSKPRAVEVDSSLAQTFEALEDE
jgi:hypothetical protein